MRAANFSDFKIKLIFATLIFAAALGVRLLAWQDLRFEAWKVHGGVAKDYGNQANHIREEGVLALFDANANASDINFMLHPPGYPLVLAAAFDLFGDSEFTIQLISIFAGAICTIFIFLIVLKILPLSVAVMSGFLAAFAPSFATNSVWLLPDTLFVLPVLLAVYFLVHAIEQPKLWKFLLCGIFVGLSCWLRANTLFLAPFLSVIVLFLFSEKRSLYAAAVTIAAILTISPITIRNAIVYQAFIPVSLGAGQTLIEGIGDYDKDKRFGFPKFDWDVTRQEAEMHNRPDYNGGLISVDGIKRDRLRVQRGINFIWENPVWFAGVMIHRALWMITPEKTQNVLTEIPISRDLKIIETMSPTANFTAIDFLEWLDCVARR